MRGITILTAGADLREVFFVRGVTVFKVGADARNFFVRRINVFKAGVGSCKVFLRGVSQFSRLAQICVRCFCGRCHSFQGWRRFV